MVTYRVKLVVTAADGRTESDEHPADSPERAVFGIRLRTGPLALAEDDWAPLSLWLDFGSHTLIEQLRQGELVYLAWQLEAVGARVEWTVRPVVDGVAVQGPAWLAPLREAVR
jgi:hypothetical protein